MKVSGLFWDEKLKDFNKKFTELYLDPYARDENSAAMRLVKGNYVDIIKWIEQFGKEACSRAINESDRIRPIVKKRIGRYLGDPKIERKKACRIKRIRQ